MSHRQHSKPDYELDDYTFGDSKAEVTIARLLNKKANPAMMRKTSKLLATVGTHLRNISLKHEGLGTRAALYRALREFYLKEVDRTLGGFDDVEIVTYVKNATVKRMTTFLKDEFKPAKKKKSLIEKTVEELRRK